MCWLGLRVIRSWAPVQLLTKEQQSASNWKTLLTEKTKHVHCLMVQTFMSKSAASNLAKIFMIHKFTCRGLPDACYMFTCVLLIFPFAPWLTDTGNNLWQWDLEENSEERWENSPCTVDCKYGQNIENDMHRFTHSHCFLQVWSVHIKAQHRKSNEYHDTAIALTNSYTDYMFPLYMLFNSSTLPLIDKCKNLHWMD